MQQGKFIVLYGCNNLGKSTQANLLVKNLINNGNKAEYLKYPRYDLEPTGPIINDVIRNGLNLSEEDLQIEFFQNRLDYEPILKQKLDNGTWIVAEDYTLTGIVWGESKGLQRDFLEALNKDLLKPDLAILLDGIRDGNFSGSIERGHRNETDDSAWWRAKHLFLELRNKYELEVVRANQDKELVTQDIWELIQNVLK